MTEVAGAPVNCTLRKRIVEKVALLEREIIDTSRWLYEHPELSGEEHEGSKLLASRAAANGFTLTMGVAGLPTAFRADLNPHPHARRRVAFLAEYDALPGVGHGCGHNIIGTVSTYAAIALASVASELDGDVCLCGTPAEETDGGKITMLNAGVFEDVTAALMCHPGMFTEVAYSSLACTSLVVEYHGKTAHAAVAPWKGINALDAMIQLFVSIDLLRKQLLPSARVSGIITAGGDRANVVPDYSRAQFSLRGRNREEMENVRDRVLQCARAAGDAIGARLEHHIEGNDYLEMRPNMQLATIYRKAWAEVGGEEPACESKPHGSLDIGNLSHRFPCLHPAVRIIEDEGVTGHSREFAQATMTPFAQEQMLKAISALALTGLEVLQNGVTG